jgi:hypothetical protein
MVADAETADAEICDGWDERYPGASVALGRSVYLVKRSPPFFLEMSCAIGVFMFIFLRVVYRF